MSLKYCDNHPLPKGEGRCDLRKPIDPSTSGRGWLTENHQNFLNWVRAGSIALAIIFVVLSIQAGAQSETFDRTVVLVQKALIERDMKYLNAHVDISGIIRSKIKKYAKRSESKGFMISSAGKLVNFSEPVITGSIVKLALSEYSKSSYALRKSYINAIKIQKIGSKDQIAFVRGIFLGKPFFASAVRSNDSWIINSIESELIDFEIKAALKSMHIIK